MCCPLNLILVIEYLVSTTMRWHSSSLLSIAATKQRTHTNPALWKWLWTRSSHWPDLWTVYPLVKLVLQQLLGNTYLLFRTLVVWWHSSSLISIAATKRRAHANPALWRWLWIVFQHVQWFFQATKTKPLQKCQSTASYVV